SVADLPVCCSTLLTFSRLAPATSDTSILSLHDALPISERVLDESVLTGMIRDHAEPAAALQCIAQFGKRRLQPTELVVHRDAERSEEHTSELQSHLNLVCRLLLEKKTR